MHDTVKCVKGACLHDFNPNEMEFKVFFISKFTIKNAQLQVNNMRGYPNVSIDVVYMNFYK